MQFFLSKVYSFGIQQNLEIANLSDIDGLLYQENIANEELDHALHCRYLF